MNKTSNHLGQWIIHFVPNLAVVPAGQQPHIILYHSMWCVLSHIVYVQCALVCGLLMLQRQQMYKHIPLGGLCIDL
jgi:hypothetical protein